MVRRRSFSILVAMLVCVVGREVSLAKGQPASATSSLKWQPTLEDAKRVAAQTNRLILVHFWAPSCKECLQLEKDVYSKPQVQQAIDARFVPLKLNSDDFPTTTKQYGVDRLPTDLIITPAGQIVGRMKCPSTPDAYLQQLNVAASGTGPASQVVNASAAAPATVGVPAANTTAAQTAIPQATNYNQPVMSNPAWAVQPPAQQIATQPVAPSAQTAAAPVKPTNPAYSDGRYAEYFSRFPNSATPAAAPVVTSAPAAGQAPAANPASPATSAPQVNSASAVPQYTSPPANPVQYNSPALAQSPSAAPAAVSWPATQAPAMTAAAATQPYAGGSIVPSPSGTLTGVAATAPAAATPVASAAPPPLGLDGYCPVTLADQKRWQVGDRRYGVIHRGRTYLFAGPVEQQKFLSSPDHYSPAISGQDVVMALDQGQTIDGQRQYGVQYQGRTYLFANDASRHAFSQNPQRYAAEVLQAENPNRPPLR